MQTSFYKKCRKRPLRFITLESGCFICISHKYEAKGYFLHGHGSDAARMHRKLWIEKYGPIPDDIQLHHKCDNKRCLNLNHIEALDRCEHALLSGQQSWDKERKHKGKWTT